MIPPIVAARIKYLVRTGRRGEAAALAVIEWLYSFGDYIDELSLWIGDIFGHLGAAFAPILGRAADDLLDLESQMRKAGILYD